MHLKVFVKLKKPLKTLSSGQKTQKKTKKPKKKQETQKNPLGWVFLKKTRVFSNPVQYGIQVWVPAPKNTNSDLRGITCSVFYND